MNRLSKASPVRTARTTRALLTALLGALAATPAAGDVRILASPGGAVVPYIELFEGVRRSGERVVIDGPCYSACTLVLSMLPRSQICVTPRAVLGFHAARAIDLPDVSSTFADLALFWTKFADMNVYCDRLDHLIERLNVKTIAPTHGLPITDVRATVPKVQEGLKAAALMPESGTNEKVPLTGAAATPAA